MGTSTKQRQASFYGKFELRRPKNADVRPREYLFDKEVSRMMKAAAKLRRYGHRDSTLILVTYRHGLRVAELIALLWDVVESDGGRLHVNRVKEGPGQEWRENAERPWCSSQVRPPGDVGERCPRNSCRPGPECATGPASSLCTTETIRPFSGPSAQPLDVRTAPEKKRSRTARHLRFYSSQGRLGPGSRSGHPSDTMMPKGGHLFFCRGSTSA